MDTDNSNIVELNYDTWNNFTSKLPTCNSSLLLFHVNIRSMFKNFAQLEYNVLKSNHKIHLIIVIEANINNNCVSLYKLHLIFRIEIK